MEDLRLSDNFWLHEFTHSQIAARAGREIIPDQEQLLNCTALCKTVLQPIRTEINRVITIDSGIRPAWVNALAGGEDKSAHLTGRAADVLVAGMQSSVFARWVAKRAEYVPFDKVIDEFSDAQGNGGWVHLQIAKPGETPRGQYLLARMVDGKKVYTFGQL